MPGARAMIEVRWDGAIATIALVRPDARNAIPIAGWQALAVAAAQVAEARVVIIASDAECIFSAGADIGEFEALRDDPAMRTRFRVAMRAGIDAIAALPMPVLAAIDGGCLGAAVALTLAADIRVAGDDAYFAVTPARLGISYPHVDVARLVAQVGRGVAATMLFTAGRIEADEAEAAGLVELRAPEAGRAVHDLAASIAANAPNAIRELKRAMRGADDDLDTAFENGFGGPELSEGLAAMRERRRAVF
ncbi:enoyl-CoA hydratase/isomerase family protein [Sphingomonas sp. RS6]